MDISYWRRQAPDQPLFPDIEWSKPERRDQAGRLGIVGGNKLGFAGVAEAYSTALGGGAGEVRVVLPSDLRKSLPATMTDVIFAPSNPSGSLSRDAIDDLRALANWSTGMLLAGDAGRNSETAILYSDLLSYYDGPLTITRDAIDLVRNDAEAIATRPRTMLVLSFAQLQKLFRELYYPKILTFNMPLMQLVETLHKFTITYPLTIVVLHRETLVMAHGGEVVTTEWADPMRIWRGTTAARAATYWLWTPSQPLEAVASSVATKSA